MKNYESLIQDFEYLKEKIRVPENLENEFYEAVENLGVRDAEKVIRKIELLRARRKGAQ